MASSRIPGSLLQRPHRRDVLRQGQVHHSLWSHAGGFPDGCRQGCRGRPDTEPESLPGLAHHLPFGPCNPGPRRARPARTWNVKSTNWPGKAPKSISIPSLRIPCGICSRESEERRASRPPDTGNLRLRRRNHSDRQEIPGPLTGQVGNMELLNDSPAPFLSVLIVNYNGKAHLPECLDSLRKQAFRDFEVVLVDNASSDGSVELVRGNHPEVHGRGVRQEPRLLRRQQLRPSPLPGTFHLLPQQRRAGRPGRPGRARGRHRGPSRHRRLRQLPDRLPQSGPGGLRRRLDLHLRQDVLCFSGYPVSLFGSPRFITAACAGAATYSRRVLDEVGAFDEDFFLNYEDLDLSFRSQHAGERILFVPSSKVFHKGSASLGGRKAPSASTTRSGTSCSSCSRTGPRRTSSASCLASCS